MERRPELNLSLSVGAFRDYYYLKEELVGFCKENGLRATGSKGELTERVAAFLATGEREACAMSYDDTKNAGAAENRSARKGRQAEITLDTVIEDDFVCSEKHRAFYKVQIGRSFSFNVAFQKWLKSNAGKTYRESVQAYRLILDDKKRGKTEIDKQFEYNTYIRDFFERNKGASLADAIKCWKYKKSISGTNKYEDGDLIALKDD